MTKVLIFEDEALVARMYEKTLKLDPEIPCTSAILIGSAAYAVPAIASPATAEPISLANKFMCDPPKKTATQSIC